MLQYHVFNFCVFIYVNFIVKVMQSDFVIFL